MDLDKTLTNYYKKHKPCEYCIFGNREFIKERLTEKENGTLRISTCMCSDFNDWQPYPFDEMYAETKDCPVCDKSLKKKRYDGLDGFVCLNSRCKMGRVFRQTRV